MQRQKLMHVTDYKIKMHSIRRFTFKYTAQLRRKQ